MFLWKIMSPVNINYISPSCVFLNGTEKQKDIRLLVACCVLTFWLSRS